MFPSEEQKRWLEAIADQLRARDDVVCEEREDGGLAFALSYNGARGALALSAAAPDFRSLKDQYSQMRAALTGLGIREGAEYVAPKRSRQPLSPQMLAARAKQRKEFDAWQELWRTLRRAEKALDVEYEIAQMKDYY